MAKNGYYEIGIKDREKSANQANRTKENLIRFSFPAPLPLIEMLLPLGLSN